MLLQIKVFRTYIDYQSKETGSRLITVFTIFKNKKNGRLIETNLKKDANRQLYQTNVNYLSIATENKGGHTPFCLPHHQHH